MSSPSSTTPDAVIHAERRGQVALLVIDRTERRNALDLDTVRRLTDAVHAAHDARALVLTGAGGHFCAGADLGGVEGEHFVEALRNLLLALTSTSQPVVAAGDGAALGAGTQLAVAGDLRVATPPARVGLPAAKPGLVVDHWSARRPTAPARGGPAPALLLP